MKQLLIFIFILSVISCNQKKVNKKDVSQENIEEVNEKGLELLTQNCLVCHKNPETQFEIIAPPMEAIKRKYLKHYDSKEKFINALVSWANEPDAIKSLMHGAIQEFEVMPDLEVNEDDFVIIANYIYDNELEKPSWINEYVSE